MRRYSVNEAPEAILIHELSELIRREEHLNPDRPDRADAYRRALQELEMGAPDATARHTLFRVNDEHTARYGVTEGSREELAAELLRYAADRRQAGKYEKAEALEEAATLLESGDREVRIEHIVYRVVEG